MVKKLIALLGALALTAAAYGGDGQVLFNTGKLGATTKVTDDAGTLLAGTAYLGQLYAAAGVGAAEASLTAVGNPVQFRGGVNAGYVAISGTTPLGWTIDPIVFIPMPADGGPATVQLRAWKASYGATYANGLIADPLLSEAGKSAPINLAATGGGLVSPVDLVGLTGFALNPIIPEPSTILLGLLGAAALLIYRRK